jgi:hypothetical protein
MRLLFCGDPLHPRRADESYAPEAAAAERLGIPWSPINVEALVHEDDAPQAVRRVPPAVGPGGEWAVYRGWMLTPGQYGALYGALAARGVRLVKTPAEYEFCHYGPRWHGALAGDTPRTVWTEAGEDVSLPRLMDLLRPFGDGPVIVKDWVKSRKHEWHDACFIPSAADAGAVGRVTGRFLERQGGDLNVGLVFREFVPLEPLAAHPRSGMPLGREFRLFFGDGEILLATRYWGGGEYPEGEEPPLDRFRELARRVRSRFFTMDVAKAAAGGWLVVELGDGGVAELPAHADAQSFYAALRDRLAAENAR